MEEAERLCDRTGIMASGSLRCIGPPEELKIRLGKGFRLNVSCPRRCVEQVRLFIEQQYPDAILDHSLAGSVIFWLPRNVSIASVCFLCSFFWVKLELGVCRFLKPWKR